MLVALLQDLNVQDNEGNTALHYAVENNAVDALSCLLKAGANMSILNGDQNGPIHLAVQLNCIKILQVFSNYLFQNIRDDDDSCRKWSRTRSWSIDH